MAETRIVRMKGKRGGGANTAGAPGKGYNDRKWRKLRARVLRERPVCECGCGEPSEVVHHVDGRGLASRRAYDPTNLQALAKSCHDRITAEAKPKRRREPELHPGLLW